MKTFATVTFALLLGAAATTANAHDEHAKAKAPPARVQAGKDAPAATGAGEAVAAAPDKAKPNGAAKQVQAGREPQAATTAADADGWSKPGVHDNTDVT